MLHEAQSRLVEHYIYTAYKHQCLIVVIVSDQRISSLVKCRYYAFAIQPLSTTKIVFDLFYYLIKTRLLRMKGVFTHQDLHISN